VPPPMVLGVAALSSPSNTAECLISLFTAIDTRMLNHHFVRAWSDSGLLRFPSPTSPQIPYRATSPHVLTCSSGGNLPQGELGRRSGAFVCPRHHVPCLLAMSSGRRVEAVGGVGPGVVGPLHRRKGSRMSRNKSYFLPNILSTTRHINLQALIQERTSHKEITSHCWKQWRIQD
jgi:hypothetical protein